MSKITMLVGRRQGMYSDQQGPYATMNRVAFAVIGDTVWQKWPHDRL